MVPLSSTARPGMNFRVAGLGVASVCMNMAFSGVAGSRPARGYPLADGDGKRTIKGRRAAVREPHQRPTPDLAQDNASISASLKSPDTMVTGIGNEPTALAIRVTSGPGPSGPGLAA